MAKVWGGSFGNTVTGATGAGTVRYWRIFGDIGIETTANNDALLVWRGAGRLSDLQIVIVANTRTSASDFQLYVNGAATGAIITVGAGATGRFYFPTPLTDGVSLADGDTICLRSTNGAGAGGSFSMGSVTYAFEGDGGITSGMHVLQSNVISIGFNASLFGGFDGYGIVTPEARLALPVRVPGRFSNLRSIVLTNTLTVSSLDAFSRKNSADGALTWTAAPGATGVREDTTNSDAVAVGDTYDLNFRGSNTGGAGSGTINFGATKFVSDGSAWELGGTLGANNPITNSTTTYFPVIGDRRRSSATEADVQLTAPFDMYVSQLRAYLSGAVLTTTVSLTLRVNGADTALTANFPTATLNPTLTNYTDYIFVQKGDLLSIKLVPPASGTRVFGYVYFVIDTAPPVATLTGPLAFDEPRRKRRRALPNFAFDPPLYQPVTTVYLPPEGFGLDRAQRRRKHGPRPSFATDVTPFPTRRKRPFIYVQT